MINALTAIMQYIGADSDLALLIAGRLAAKHKFGTGTADAWPTPSKAVALAQSGGDPDLYTLMQRQRLEARCYGERQREASKVADALIAITRRFDRTVVDTGAGRALIYYLVVDGGPDFLFDPDLELDYVQLFLRAAVAEEPVL